MIKIINASTVSTFTWSTSEQVWPFEKDQDGSTLYARQFNMGTMPNNGTVYQSHNIPSFTPAKIKRMLCKAYSSNGVACVPIPYGVWNGGTNYDLNLNADATTVRIDTTQNWSNYTATIELIYSH